MSKQSNSSKNLKSVLLIGDSYGTKRNSISSGKNVVEKPWPTLVINKFKDNTIIDSDFKGYRTLLSSIELGNKKIYKMIREELYLHI